MPSRLASLVGALAVLSLALVACATAPRPATISGGAAKRSAVTIALDRSYRGSVHPGHEQWFRVPAQPGATVTLSIDMSGPAGAELAYADSTVDWNPAPDSLHSGGGGPFDASQGAYLVLRPQSTATEDASFRFQFRPN